MASTSQGAVADYERGHKVPSFSTFRRLLGALGAVIVVRHVDGHELAFDQPLDHPVVRALWERRNEVLACAKAYQASEVHLGLPSGGASDANAVVGSHAELPFKHSVEDLIAFESSLERLLGLSGTVHVLTDMQHRKPRD
jgi:hypothetical protein